MYLIPQTGSVILKKDTMKATLNFKVNLSLLLLGKKGGNMETIHYAEAAVRKTLKASFSLNF